MSNPPVPPSGPDNSDPAPRPAPQYGQQAPQYGQPAPQPPRYGQVDPNLPQYGQPAPPYDQPGYGYSPYNPYPPGQPQSPEAVPRLVNTAFWLIVGSGALWLLTVLLSIGLLDTPAIREQFEEQIAASGAEVDYNSIKGILVGTIVVFAAIGAGLYALVALNIRKGKNWARILGTVFAALSILSLVPLGPGTLSALAGIAGIVLLYLPDAAPYFQKRQQFANPYGQPGAPFGK